MSDDLGGQGAAGSSTRNAGIDQPGNLTLDELAAFERDFDGVDAALARLSDGTYWTDEVTGQPLPADLLEEHPIARTAGPAE